MSAFRPKGHIMKTRVFEPGAICAAIALLLVLSLPAYAKNGGSSGAQTRVSKTPSNTNSVKPVTSSRKTQSGTLQKSGTVAVQPKSNSANKTKKEVDTLKQPLGKVDRDIDKLLKANEHQNTKEKAVQDNIKNQQDKSGSIQKNLDAATDKQRETSKTINCLVNC